MSRDPARDQSAGAVPETGQVPSRAVIWGSRVAQEALAKVMRTRNLLPEHVESAPAAVLAGLRPGGRPTALILVEPGRLLRVDEVVEIYRAHVPDVRCWRFEPSAAGPGGAGVLEPLRRGPGLDTIGPGGRPATRGPSMAASAGGSTGRSAASGNLSVDCGQGSSARLTRAELSMLLGPTRTFQSPGGDAE